MPGAAVDRTIGGINDHFNEGEPDATIFLFFARRGNVEVKNMGKQLRGDATAIITYGNCFVCFIYCNGHLTRLPMGDGVFNKVGEEVGQDTGNHLGRKVFFAGNMHLYMGWKSVCYALYPFSGCL